MNLKYIILLFAVSFLWRLTCSTSFTQFELGNERTFDFIIVGGGTGGSVVARRLAEGGKYSVLVIHEGAVANDNLNIPALAENFQNYRYPSEMKYYFSVPQKNANLIGDGISIHPIGKAIGGGSSVNGMFWNRGNPLVYNEWANISNDSSWSYENMLPFFRKSENYRGFNPTNQRGYDGPISIENRKDVKYGVTEFISASNEIGYPFGDANGPQTLSAALVDYSTFRGRRASAFSGYIGPLLSRNLHGIGLLNEKQSKLIILLNTTAMRIIFEEDKAIGVTFISHNSSQPDFAKAKKEIILCAGTMDSPAILMRSGIGPKSVLDSAKIRVVRYLEGVGKNLQDHVLMPAPVIVGNPSIGFIPARDLTPEAWKEYQSFGTGPYSLYCAAGAQGFFLSSGQPAAQMQWPDVHLLPMFCEIAQLPEAKEDEISLSWFIFMTRYKSRGTLTLDPVNIDNQLVIDPNYFDHPDDLAAMIDAIKLVYKICEETTAMQKIGCRVPTTPLTPCKQFPFRSDSYYECTIRQLSNSGVHAAGTCKMGRNVDPEAVVDSKLKVIGIQNLRIVDASVMPVVTNANLQAPVYAIAERAADMILKKWNEDWTSYLD